MSAPKTWSARAAAVVAALALALTGLVAPAHAAGTGTISGTVTAPTGVKRAGSLVLLKWSPSQHYWDWSDAVPVTETGTFSFSGIDAGVEYTLRFSPAAPGSQGFAPGQMLGGGHGYDTRVPSQVIVGTSGPQTVTFALDPGVTIRGKVNVPSGVAGPVQVALRESDYWHKADVPIFDGNQWRDTVQLAADGSFTFPHVRAGTKHSVSVLGSSTGGHVTHEPITITGTGLPYGTASTRLITGDTTLPTVTMQRSVPAKGKVLLPAGLAAADTTVRLIEVDALGYIDDAWDPAMEIPLEADGTFTFTEGAFPGHSYTVLATTPLGETYLGMSPWVEMALTYQAGASGLTFPDMPVIIPATTSSAWTSGTVLRGAPSVGETLELRGPGGVLGDLSSTAGATITYQWMRGSEKIPGATSPKYTLTTADLNTFVSAWTIVRAPGYKADVRESEEYLVVEGRAPYATSYPTISGSAKVGGTLAVSKGSWSVPSATLAYQWLRDGAVVAGATSSSYSLKPADRGRSFSVRISASAPGYVTGTSITAPSAKVAKGDAAKAKKKPKVKGKKRVGKKLTVTKGKWSLAGVKVTFQWLRDGKKIKKATKKKYKLKKKDAGKRISVRVTVKKAGYKNAKVVTKATKKIKPKKK